MNLNEVYDMVQAWEDRLFYYAYEQPCFHKCDWCSEELQESDPQWVDHPTEDKAFCCEDCLNECLEEQEWEREQENE